MAHIILRPASYPSPGGIKPQEISSAIWIMDEANAERVLSSDVFFSTASNSYADSKPLAARCFWSEPFVIPNLSRRLNVSPCESGVTPFFSIEDSVASVTAFPISSPSFECFPALCSTLPHSVLQSTVVQTASGDHPVASQTLCGASKSRPVERAVEKTEAGSMCKKSKKVIQANSWIYMPTQHFP